jgi:hypothetical protein
MTKSKKSPAEKIKAGRARMAASPLGQLADTVLGFALPVGKVKAAAAGLHAAGKISQSIALESRVIAKEIGKELGKDANRVGRGQYAEAFGPSFRKDSLSVFPRAAKAAKSGTQAFNERKSILASKRQSDKWLKGIK